MKKLANKIAKILNDGVSYELDFPVSVEDVEAWLESIDEDETVAQEPEDLAEWFYADL